VDDKLDRIMESLQQLTVQVESLRVTVGSVVGAVEDHEARLRRIETWQNNLTPVIAVGTFVLGSLFDLFLRRWK
jgi:hypothetical protein